jgi:hypothetical protein
MQIKIFILSFINPIFKNIFTFILGITRNKTFEFQIYHYLDYLLTFEFDLSFRGKDHAGPHLEFSFFGYYFSFLIYDNRHWNYEKNDWE